MLKMSKSLTESSRTSRVAAFCSLAIGVGITVWLAPAMEHVSLALEQDEIGIRHPMQDFAAEEARFYTGVYFDEPNLYGDISLPMLFGSGSLSGSISYRGAPADVSVRAFLGKYWRTETVRTGDDGRFTLTVPKQDLGINRIDLDYWFDKPSGMGQKLVIIRHPTVAFSDAFFERTRYAEMIRAQDGGEIELQIVDFIEMKWPRYGVTEQIGEAATQSVSWQPVEDAAYYEVVVSKYSRDRQSASRHYRTTTTSPYVALSDLSLVESEETHEYYVVIRAYDDSRTFLSTSKSGFNESSFAIPGFIIEPNAARRPCDD